MDDENIILLQLLNGLNTIDWPSHSRKCSATGSGVLLAPTVRFKSTITMLKLKSLPPRHLIWLTFMTLAPEHDLVDRITTSDPEAEVDLYIKQSANRSEEIECRMSRTSQVFFRVLCHSYLSGKKNPYGLETMFLLLWYWCCHGSTMGISATLNLPSISTSPLQTY